MRRHDVVAHVACAGRCRCCPALRRLEHSRTAWLEALRLCPSGGAGRFIEGGTTNRAYRRTATNTGGGQLSGGRIHGFIHSTRPVCSCVRGRCPPSTALPKVSAVAVGAVSFTGCMLVAAAGARPQGSCSVRRKIALAQARAGGENEVRTVRRVGLCVIFTQKMRDPSIELLPLSVRPYAFCNPRPQYGLRALGRPPRVSVSFTWPGPRSWPIVL